MSYDPKTLFAVPIKRPIFEDYNRPVERISLKKQKPFPASSPYGFSNGSSVKGQRSNTSYTWASNASNISPPTRKRKKKREEPSASEIDEIMKINVTIKNDLAAPSPTPPRKHRKPPKTAPSKGHLAALFDGMESDYE